MLLLFDYHRTISNAMASIRALNLWQSRPLEHVLTYYCQGKLVISATELIAVTGNSYFQTWDECVTFWEVVTQACSTHRYIDFYSFWKVTCWILKTDLLLMQIVLYFAELFSFNRRLIHSQYFKFINCWSEVCQFTSVVCTLFSIMISCQINSLKYVKWTVWILLPF